MSRVVPTLGALVFLALPLAAQEKPEHGEKDHAHGAEMASVMESWEKAGTPGEMHRALARTAGEWTAEVRMWMGPEPTVSEARTTVEPIMNGRFVKETVKSDFMGKPFHGVSIIGFNNVTGEVEAVWYDDHSTGIYVYRGSMNEDGTELKLKGKYKDPSSGEWITTRSVRKIMGDEMRDTAWETRDGEEKKTMEITYRRES